MRNIIIALTLLSAVACSKKNDPVPATSVKDLIGHYTGSVTTTSPTTSVPITLAVDIVITKSGSTYNVTGSYVIDGKTTTITKSEVIPPIPGQIIAWQLFLNTTSSTGLTLVGPVSADFNTFTSNVLNCKDIPGGLGSAAISLTRKAA